MKRNSPIPFSMVLLIVMTVAALAAVIYRTERPRSVQPELPLTSEVRTNS